MFAVEASLLSQSEAMKSVLWSITHRIEEPSDGVNDSRSSASVAAVESTSEQLAELRLLSRVEHDGSPSGSFTSGGDGEDGDEEEQRHERRDTGRVEKKSMFTALLGSAAKVMATQPVSASPPSSSSGVISAPAPKNITTPERFRRGSTLPTLCEELFEEECDVVPGDEDEDEIAILERSASFDSPDAFGGRRPSSLRCVSGIQDQMTEAEPEDAGSEDDDEEGEDEEAFAHMLSQLPSDYELLALSCSDLTTRRLDRVRAALTSQLPDPVMKTTSGTEERVEASESFGNPAVFKMRQTRTVVAVDTLRMLVQRHGTERVVWAVTSAVRQVFRKHALETGIDLLAQAPIVVTSSNITRVALDVRQVLMSDNRDSKANSSNQRRCSTPSTGPNMKLHQQSESVRAGATGRSQPSQNQSRSPRGATGSPSSHHSSAISPSSPLTPQPRSILASDGAHVLIQEKISAFQYRGTSGSGLSSFRIRRDGVAKVEAAAVRRQRSIAYGNEQTRKPLAK